MRASLLVSVSTLLVGVLGFVNQLAQAKTFGTSPEMDIYVAAMAPPSVLMGLIPSVIVSLFIPSLVKHKDDACSKQLHSTLFLIILGISVVTMLVGVLGSDILVKWLVPFASGLSYGIAVTTSKLLWLATGLSILVSYLAAARFSEKRFTLASLLPIASPLSTVACILLLASKIGTESIALGLVVGSAFQVIVLLSTQIHDIKVSRISFSHPELRVIISRLAPVIVSQFPFALPPLIAAYWASKTTPNGLSYLGYSYSLTGFLSVTISYGISIVAFPNMTEDIGRGAYRTALAGVEKRLRIIILIAVPLAAFCIALREPLLRIGFQRGAFDEVSVQGTSNVLPWYLIGMVGIACLNLLRNFYYSQGRYGKTAAMGVLTTAFFACLAGINTNLMSYPGIGLAYAISCLLLFVLAISWMGESRWGLWSIDFVRYLVQVIMASGLGAIISYLLWSYLQYELQQFISLFISASIGLLVFLALSLRITRIAELYTLFNKLGVHFLNQ